MRILFLDPIGGISGDMTLGALVDLGVPLSHLESQLSGLGVPGWHLEAHEVEVMGLRATKVDVVLDVPTPHHAHRPWKEIRRLIDASPLGARAKAVAQDAFARLARAEGRAHGVDPEEVELHEVGAVDAIVDICGAAVCIEHLAPEAVWAAPPPLGHGFVHAAHGRLPVPGPATLALLEGLPVAASETEGELTTPTGAALLATLASGRVGPMPALTPRAVGYGAGTARWPDRPNVLRAVLAETAAERPEVLVVEANLDDMSPELLPAAIDACLAAGALDALVVPVLMKKGRPGHLLQVLCRPAAREAVVRAVLRETTTFGVRLRAAERVELERAHERVDTPYGPMRIKVGRLGGEVLTASPEYEDCRALAEQAGVPVRRVLEAARVAWGERAMLPARDEVEP